MLRADKKCKFSADVSSNDSDAADSSLSAADNIPRANLISILNRFGHTPQIYVLTELLNSVEERK